jgi:hypothetical protein
VSAAREPFERLIRLGQILSRESVNGRGSADAHPLRPPEFQIERIRLLTGELHLGSDSDEVDAVTMRVLLNDYAATLTAFREMARQAASHLTAASDPIKEARRYLKRQDKQKRKRDEESASG